ncbi:hypothetical protein L7F22_044981 [Adiantum nelumboides]|nr:hypothetical protein [Adiantum nelumboides]
MQNDEGENLDLYISKKCSTLNRLITTKDHAYVQLNIGHLENSFYTGQFTTFALSGLPKLKVMQKVPLIVFGRNQGPRLFPWSAGVSASSTTSALEIVELHLQMRQEFFFDVERAVRVNHEALKHGKMLKVPYTTLFEYLQILHIIATTLFQLKQLAMFYLAAAVSDLYVPWESMGEHKI